LLSIVPLLHWHTRSSGSSSLFPSFPCFFSFLFSIPSVSCTLPFHPFCPQTLPFSFLLSLSACSSYTLPSLCNLAFLCSFLPPLSNIFLAHSLAPLVSFIPRFLPRTSIYSLYHALKHHHSPPEITYPLSLSYFPHTSHYLVCVPHYLSHVCLVRGSFVEGVAQVYELTHSFYFPSFPRPLILFTLPLSLVEHLHFRLFNIHFQLFPPHVLSQAPHLSLTLCHYYQVVRKCQAPNLLI
jgi:hypothetical protein